MVSGKCARAVWVSVRSPELRLEEPDSKQVEALSDLCQRKEFRESESVWE